VQFVDTNILIYSISGDPGEREKADRANRILAAGDLGLSAQVLQEFYVQATREKRPGRLTHERAAGLVESFSRFPVQGITAGIVEAAIATRHRFRISYWDAAILEAARALGCETVLSEDLSDGQDYAGVSVQNPFQPIA
jgi:predicted nucleic acid-binding protein